MKSILIAGAGRFGRYTAIKLHDLGHQVMVIDKDESKINRVLPFCSDARIGDSTDPSFLNTLGVRNYDVCIVSIGDDFLSSLQTTFTLDELGAKKIIARATSSRQEKFLLRNGASAVVFPERELGFWTAIRYSSDNISNYVELSDGYSIIETGVPDRWNGKRVGNLDVRRKYHINILGIRAAKPERDLFAGTGRVPGFGRPERPSLFGVREPVPAGPQMDMDIRFDTILRSGQTMLVLGRTEEVLKIL